MQYVLISKNSTLELTNKVNKLIEQGWKLYGNPFSVRFGNNHYTVN